MGGGDASNNAQPLSNDSSSDPLSIHAPATNNLAIQRVIMTCALSPAGELRGWRRNACPTHSNYRRDHGSGFTPKPTRHLGKLVLGCQFEWAGIYWTTKG